MDDQIISNTTDTNNNNSPDSTNGGIGEGIFTRKGLADKLRWPEERLTRMHCQREGPPRIKVGKSIFYHWPSVVEWLLTYQQEEPRTKRRKASKA